MQSWQVKTLVELWRIMIDIKGTPLYLEFAEEHHFKNSAGWLADQDINKLSDLGKFRNPKPLVPGDMENGIVFAVMEKDFRESAIVDSEHIGNISLNVVGTNWIHRNMDLSCVFIKNSWGKGYGTLAVREVILYGFKTLNLNRIGLGTVIHNKGMIRIAEKNLMMPEGILRQDRYIDGEYVDVVRYGIVRSDYSREVK